MRRRRTIRSRPSRDTRQLFATVMARHRAFASTTPIACRRRSVTTPSRCRARPPYVDLGLAVTLRQPARPSARRCAPHVGMAVEGVGQVVMTPSYLLWRSQALARGVRARRRAARPHARCRRGPRGRGSAVRSSSSAASASPRDRRRSVLRDGHARGRDRDLSGAQRAARVDRHARGVAVRPSSAARRRRLRSVVPAAWRRRLRRHRRLRDRGEARLDRDRLFAQARKGDGLRALPRLRPRYDRAASGRAIRTCRPRRCCRRRASRSSTTARSASRALALGVVREVRVVRRRQCSDDAERSASSARSCPSASVGHRVAGAGGPVSSRMRRSALARRCLRAGALRLGVQADGSRPPATSRTTARSASPPTGTRLARAQHVPRASSERRLGHRGAARVRRRGAPLFPARAGLARKGSAATSPTCPTGLMRHAALALLVRLRLEHGRPSFAISRAVCATRRRSSRRRRSSARRAVGEAILAAVGVLPRRRRTTACPREASPALRAMLPRPVRVYLGRRARAPRGRLLLPPSDAARARVTASDARRSPSSRRTDGVWTRRSRWKAATCLVRWAEADQIVQLDRPLPPTGSSGAGRMRCASRRCARARFPSEALPRSPQGGREPLPSRVATGGRRSCRRGRKRATRTAIVIRGPDAERPKRFSRPRRGKDL